MLVYHSLIQYACWRTRQSSLCFTTQFFVRCCCCCCCCSILLHLLEITLQRAALCSHFPSRILLILIWVFLFFSSFNLIVVALCVDLLVWHIGFMTYWACCSSFAFVHGQLNVCFSLFDSYILCIVIYKHVYGNYTADISRVVRKHSLVSISREAFLLLPSCCFGLFFPSPWVSLVLFPSRSSSWSFFLSNSLSASILPPLSAPLASSCLLFHLLLHLLLA